MVPFDERSRALSSISLRYQAAILHPFLQCLISMLAFLVVRHCRVAASRSPMRLSSSLFCSVLRDHA